MNKITNTIYENFNPLPPDITGWHGTGSLFGNLIDKVKPNHIIEVGTWKGQSAITMAKHIQSTGLDCKITCVDTWLGALEFWKDLRETPERDLMLRHGYPQVYYQFLSNVIHSGAQNVILPMPLPSSIAWKAIDRKAQLIYIDGSHEYEDVKADCLNFWNLLDDGGVMFGDDINWLGVERAVKEVFNDLEIIEGIFWVARK
jgi:hypothetical protein